MHILVISSNHPPFHSGGYELRVRDIIDGLAQRGHQICVLTNQPEKRLTSPAQLSPYPVIRRLHNRHRARCFPREILFDLLDTALLEREIQHFKPDLIYLGHTYILSKALLPYLASQSLPIVYDEGGAGLVEAWTEHGRWFRFTGDFSTGMPLIDLLKPPVIRMVCALSRGRIKPQWQWPQNMQIIFNSELNRRVAVKAGVPAERSTVIHSGVDTELFTFKPRTALGTPLHILTPGRIERRKGQKDAVELLHHLLQSGVNARLTLAGGSWSDGYYKDVIELVQSLGLVENIEILPMLSRTELVKQYHQADICFISSYQQVGFSRVPVEAMACGCIVISYGNEGSNEIIKNNETGFLVEPGRYQDITAKINSFIHSSHSLETLTNNARNEIVNNYSLEKYIDRIETILSIVSKENRCTP